MLVAAGGVRRRPDADGVLGDRVEAPDELAVLGVIGLDEAADAILAAVGADQDFAVDGGWRHRLAVALLGIADLFLPDDGAGLGVERDELRVERADIDLVVIDRDAAVVRPAAEGRDRTELRLEVPDLLAGLGVERIDVAVGGGDVHDAVNNDRRRLQRLFDFGGEDPGRMQMPHVAAVDLRVRIETRLLVIGVGVEEVFPVLVGVSELLLRDRRDRGSRRHCTRCVFDFLRLCYPRGYDCPDANRTEQHCAIDVFGHRRSLHALAYCLEMTGLSPIGTGMCSLFPTNQRTSAPRAPSPSAPRGRDSDPTSTRWSACAPSPSRSPERLASAASARLGSPRPCARPLRPTRGSGRRARPRAGPTSRTG